MGSLRSKRSFDIIAVTLSAPIWLPIMLGVAIWIRMKLGSPIFFRQKRLGHHGTSFELIKFRTMTDERDAAGVLLPDALRLTDFGRLLRSTSLDELPELINVLKGEMSLVGPRPLLVQYLSRYNSHQRRRHEVPPGLTGLVQVSGRNALSWEDKFELDVSYVDHRTFLGDLRILFRTVWQVVSRHGISAPGDATMPEFNPRR